MRKRRKAVTTKDPDLSDAGRARAESLANVLKDAGITAIYATELKRTQQTAAPLARLSECRGHDRRRRTTQRR